MSLFQDFDFFHGSIDLKECKMLLKENGDFLLRNMMTTNQQNDTCVRCILCVSAGNAPVNDEENDSRIRSFGIGQESDGFIIQGHVEQFPTIQKLIESYLTTRKELMDGIILIRPICRQSWELGLNDISISEQELGKGSFGSVFKGKLVKQDVDIALKRLNECSDEKIVEVLQESRIMRILDHNNIIKLHGVVLEKSPIMLAIEYVDGCSLTNMLKEKLIPNGYRFSIICALMYGLRYVHEKKVIHRDVAARNVLISNDCKDVKIIDFGLSKNGTSYVLKTAQKIPTKWLSPEVIHKGQFSTKSDIWAFAVTIWEIYNNGAEPYPNKKNADVKLFLRDSKSAEAHRLTLDNCTSDEKPPNGLNEIVRLLFNYSPSNRPSLDRVAAVIESDVFAKLTADQVETCRHHTQKKMGASSSTSNELRKFEKNKNVTTKRRKSKAPPSANGKQKTSRRKKK